MNMNLSAVSRPLTSPPYRSRSIQRRVRSSDRAGGEGVDEPAWSKRPLVPKRILKHKARLDNLAKKVSCARNGEKSAVEVLSEMRR